MRIISGIRRGHKLHDFGGYDIRPTTDRVKEAIFSMITPYISGAEVLDMFAGSGALSFEMLSRGAAHAVLVDKDKRSVDVITKNAASLGFCDMCEIVTCSCFDYARRCGRKFDVIFLDPPYNKGFITEAFAAIADNGILSDDGIIVLESDSTDFRDEYDGLEMIKQKKYGRTYITIYRQVKNESSCISGKL